MIIWVGLLRIGMSLTKIKVKLKIKINGSVGQGHWRQFINSKNTISKFVKIMQVVRIRARIRGNRLRY